MSAGHIYKYFENKEAIMTALIEHHMDEFSVLIAEIDQSEKRTVQSLVQSFVAKLPSILKDDRTALWLEIQAEAGRNPRVREMSILSANRFRETIRKVIEPVLEGNTEEEIDTRVEMLLICMHGLGLQASAQSGSGFLALATAVELTFQTMLTTGLQSVAPRKVKAA